MAGAGVHPVARFISLVAAETIAPDACWLWAGGGKGNGYGAFNLEGTSEPAHRVSYKLFCGEIPPAQDVCHSCDNRWCVNPDHLFLGTRAENMADCQRKGRTSGHYRKHLKEAQVQEVRRLLGAGHRITKVARITGISHSVVSNIGKGKSYGRIGQ